MGSLTLLQCSSKEEVEDIQANVAKLLADVKCEDHFVIEVAPYGPEYFPMDFLEKGCNVLAKTFQATDPRKGCIGIMIAWKSL